MGQTITTLGIDIDIPNLRQELLNVIETEVESNIRLRKDAQVYNLRLVPYKSDAINVVGVMMFFENIQKLTSLSSDVDGHRSLELLGEYLPFGLVAIDQTGVMTYCNQKVTDLTGYSTEELLHHKVKMFMPDPYRQYHDDDFIDYLSGQSKDDIGRWRDITVLTREGARKLYKMRTEQTWINAERFFLGYLVQPERLNELT